jgi:hypothetical protein
MRAPTPLSIGRIVATPGALEAVTPERMSACLSRHISGDWGALDPEDIRANDTAAEEGRRILSAYPIDPAIPSPGYGDNTLWIITEADRSTTTFLLPSEY